MGDWFFGLLTGIILTLVVGWACYQRHYRAKHKYLEIMKDEPDRDNGVSHIKTSEQERGDKSKMD